MATTNEKTLLDCKVPLTMAAIELDSALCNYVYGQGADEDVAEALRVVARRLDDVRVAWARVQIERTSADEQAFRRWAEQKAVAQ